jgi:hypothetical protein
MILVSNSMDWKTIGKLFFFRLISSNRIDADLLPISKPGWSIVESFGDITLDINQLLKPKTAIRVGIAIPTSLKYLIIPIATKSVTAKIASISGCSSTIFFAFS